MSIVTMCSACKPASESILCDPEGSSPNGSVPVPYLTIHEDGALAPKHVEVIYKLCIVSNHVVCTVFECVLNVVLTNAIVEHGSNSDSSSVHDL